MSILGKIMSVIFGTTPRQRHQLRHLGGGGATSSSDAAAAGSNVDVAAILDNAVARKKEKLTWRTSIVDLMKALDVDSLPSSVIFPVNNIAIVMLSTLGAWLIFREKLSKINVVGIVLAIIAISLIAVQNII